MRQQFQPEALLREAGLLASSNEQSYISRLIFLWAVNREPVGLFRKELTVSADSPRARREWVPRQKLRQRPQS